MKKFLLVTATVLVLGFGTLTGLLYGSGSTWDNVQFQYDTNILASTLIGHKATFGEKVRIYIECYKENVHCKGLEDIKHLEK